MIRVFVAYRNRDAVLFYLDHTTIEEVRNKFLGSYPVFQTSEGPKTIDWDDIKKVYIQECEHKRVIGEVTEIDLTPKRLQGGMKMGVEEPVQTSDPTKAASVQEVDVSIKGTEDNSVVSDAAVLENSTNQSNVDVNLTNALGNVVAQEDKQVAVDAKILNEKFRSFREKFLELENDQESWEAQIIEKMAARKDLLKTFADTIDEENTALDVFKTDKVGS